MPSIKKVSLAILIVFYILAGINHFRVPEFYISIIPGYLPHPILLNIVAGTCELLFGLLLIFPKTRKYSCYGIMMMLMAFLPVHIAMLSGYTRAGSMTVTPVWAWVRLLFQPLLIWWAWWHRK
jgi:uncharacterized membrane protein